MKSLEKRAAAMEEKYRSQFAERGGVTPSDPLKFHLYHLVLYWSRLVGFCRQLPDEPAGWIDGDLGACVLVGTKYVDQLIKSSDGEYLAWSNYSMLAARVLHQRPVNLEQVEEASKSLDEFLLQKNFDVWAWIRCE